MTFIFEARPARKGDALVLHFGTKTKPGLAVIDGGPAKVYFPHIKPRLDEIRAERALAPNKPLPIDLLMISHIDDDHMVGVLEMTSEIVDAHDQQQPLPYAIANVWHNTFDDVLDTTPEELQASITAQFGAADTEEAVLGQWASLPPDSARVLASVAQGRTLRDHVAKLQLPLNAAFDGKLVRLLKGATAPVKLGTAAQGGIELRVIAPSNDRLLALQKAHDAWLKLKKLGRSSREAALAAFSDQSPTNLSSIVVEVRSGTKTVLLTGDARGDHILEGLKARKLMTGTKPYKVDVLKGPHHGSDNNVTKEFFDSVVADHYVFSGNGEHGNPERETLQMLFEARGAPSLKGKPFTVWLTYPVKDIDAGRAVDWEKERKKGNKTRKWDPAKDSLGALFKKTPLAALGATIVDDKPISIALA